MNRRRLHAVRASSIVLLLAQATAAPVSYYKDVRPALQAKCMGCHQPVWAKLSTSLRRLIIERTTWLLIKKFAIS
jgi:hypothetical protein